MGKLDYFSTAFGGIFTKIIARTKPPKTTKSINAVTKKSIKKFITPFDPRINNFMDFSSKR
ncbi:hypothetical protein C4572_02850 [Candidatus Parcubacteria bacterium]|nr:MAG: hypothetical protein C4572_02850 [Candidatus Parcubacteria bacterium]